VKDEEIDWLIYHQIAGDEGADIAGLARATSLEESRVIDSLERLEKSLLIECRDDKAYLLSVNESLVRCQAKYDPALPFTIENGVVKAKKR